MEHWIGAQFGLQINVLLNLQTRQLHALQEEKCVYSVSLLLPGAGLCYGSRLGRRVAGIGVTEFRLTNPLRKPSVGE